MKKSSVVGTIAAFALILLTAKDYYYHTGTLLCAVCGARGTDRGIYHMRKEEPSVEWVKVHPTITSRMMEEAFRPCLAHVWVPFGGGYNRGLFSGEHFDNFGRSYHVCGLYPPNSIPWRGSEHLSSLTVMEQMPRPKRQAVLAAIRGSDSWTGKFAHALALSWAYRQEKGASEAELEKFWQEYAHLLERQEDTSIAEPLAKNYVDDQDPFVAAFAAQTLKELEWHSWIIEDVEAGREVFPFTPVDVAAEAVRGPESWY